MAKKPVRQTEREVSRLTDRLGMPIDKKIRPLVIGLRSLGITTQMSCQGHLGWGCPHPWVDFPIQELPRVERLLRQYNRTHARNGSPKKEWGYWKRGIEGKGGFRIEPKYRKRSLLEMQREAEEFGYLLQRSRSLQALASS